MACFELQFGSTTVVTDPCITKVCTNDLTWGAVEHCDIIAVTQKNVVRKLQPDIAILQLSRQDPVAMAEFAALRDCKVVIPHHMDLLKFREQYLPSVEWMRQEYLRKVPGGTFVIPENGGWLEL